MPTNEHTLADGAVTVDTKKINKRKVAKLVIGNAVGFSVGAVVTGAARNNIAGYTRFQKAQVLIGTIALGAYVGDKVQHWADDQVDQWCDSWNKARQEQDAKKLKSV